MNIDFALSVSVNNVIQKTWFCSMNEIGEITNEHGDFIFDKPIYLFFGDHIMKKWMEKNSSISICLNEVSFSIRPYHPKHYFLRDIMTEEIMTAFNKINILSIGLS